MSKLDVHHHFYPLAMRKALEEAGGDPSGWYTPPWTLQLDRAICKDIGVTTTILSVTAPGPVIMKDAMSAARLARQCNDEAALIRNASPQEYGFFASVPSLFDTDYAIQEIRHAFDNLGADGITLFTRYGQGANYLGHNAFEPVWAELSRRSAVVFIHPTHPQDTEFVNQFMPQPMFDYPHETGRAAMDLITSGRLRQHPGCRIILSHAGGTMPYLIHRAATMLPYMPDGLERTREQILEEARGFYFDTAISSNPVTLGALCEFAKPGHILFGSDFPNAPRDAVLHFTRFFDDYNFPNGTGPLAKREAAIKLFPRYQGKGSPDEVKLELHLSFMRDARY